RRLYDGELSGRPRRPRVGPGRDDGAGPQRICGLLPAGGGKGRGAGRVRPGGGISRCCPGTDGAQVRRRSYGRPLSCRHRPSNIKNNRSEGANVMIGRKLTILAAALTVGLAWSAGSTAWSQTVRITPLGSHDG